MLQQEVRQTYKNLLEEKENFNGWCTTPGYVHFKEMYINLAYKTTEVVMFAPKLFRLHMYIMYMLHVVFKPTFILFVVYHLT